MTSTLENSVFNYFLDIELPGFNAEEISVHILPNERKIVVEARQNPNYGHTVLKRPIYHQTICPSDSMIESVSAVLSLGNLRINIPKNPSYTRNQNILAIPIIRHN